MDLCQHALIISKILSFMEFHCRSSKYWLILQAALPQNSLNPTKPLPFPAFPSGDQAPWPTQSSLAKSRVPQRGKQGWARWLLNHGHLPAPACSCCCHPPSPPFSQGRVPHRWMAQPATVLFPEWPGASWTPAASLGSGQALPRHQSQPVCGPPFTVPSLQALPNQPRVLRWGRAGLAVPLLPPEYLVGF